MGTATSPDSSKTAKEIIKKYVENESTYADPIICWHQHKIGKNYMDDDDLTVFWFVEEPRLFFDIQKGNK